MDDPTAGVEDEPVSISRALAKEIRHRRDLLHWSAARLAEEVAANGGNLPRHAISKIETGVREVSIDELLYIAAALDVPVIDLLEATPIPPGARLIGDPPEPGPRRTITIRIPTGSSISLEG
jgi:transcriptional regulator with XRE-family HTH domain